MASNYKTLHILGAGAFGSVLANILTDTKGANVGRPQPPLLQPKMHGRSANYQDIFNNLATQYPATSLPIFVALPVHAYHEVFQQLLISSQTHAPSLIPSFVIFSKGMHQGQLPSQIIKNYFPKSPIAVLAGPNLAHELLEKKPTASVLASQNLKLLVDTKMLLQKSYWRIYGSSDIYGLQLCGVAKNILAIASGIVLGKNLGDNARATLITRGLYEMKKLLQAQAAIEKTINYETCFGLAGVGDLMLTANSPQSRNTSFGIRLALGKDIKTALSESKGVVEGYYAAPYLTEYANKLAIELPIIEAVTKILHQNLSLDTAITELMARPVPELETANDA